MSHIQNSEKQSIRRQMLKKRDRLTAAQISSASDALWNSLSDLLLSSHRKKERPLSVMAYMSFRGEFPTEDFCKKIIEYQMKLILPFTDENFILHPCRVHSLDELKTSRLGIREPNPAIHTEVSADEPDVILLPGVAFDRRGNRVGFGRGCYDRFLAERTSPVVLIGAAYDFQLTEDPLPTEPTDIPVEYLVTEKGLHLCR